VTLTAAEISGLTHHGIRSAVADLTQRVGRSLDRVTIAAAEQIAFSDASLGYTEPETSYAQVLTEGVMLVLLYEQQEFDYRISGIHGLLCDNAQPFQAVEGRPLEGPWSRLADLPMSRSEVAVAELEGKIYVLGGFG